MINRVLVVEDSRSIASRLYNTIKESLDFEVVLAQSYEAAKGILKKDKNIDIALLDLGLPDAPHGEIVELVSKDKIPMIILSGTENPNEALIQNPLVIDYIIKDRSYAIEQAVKMIRRFINNVHYTVLIVDDSKVMVEKMKDICMRYNLNTMVAYNAEDALRIFEKNSVQLVFVDYLLSGMSGLELTSKIRNISSSDEVGVIAVSGTEDKRVVSKFLKYGANDFIFKNSSVEEFVARLNNNIDILELIAYNKNRANKDFLTGMYNRRYLFEQATQLYTQAVEKKGSLYVGILDIDKFKNINDSYGHDVGDIAIKVIANILHKVLDESSLVARMGGEEFCVVLKNMDEHKARVMFESIRKKIESNIIKLPTMDLSYTVSIGFTSLLNSSGFDEMIKVADTALYEAKEGGRNQVVYTA